MKCFATICPFCILLPLCLSPFLQFPYPSVYLICSLIFLQLLLAFCSLKTQKSGCIILISRHGPLLLMVFSAFCCPLQAQALLADLCWAPWSGEDGHWGPRRASKWMSWSQDSKCEHFLNKYAVKLLNSVKMSWCIFPVWWGTTGKYFLIWFLCHAQTVSCTPFSPWICQVKQHWEPYKNGDIFYLLPSYLWGALLYYWTKINYIWQ